MKRVLCRRYWWYCFTLSFCPVIKGIRVLDGIYNVVTYFSKDFQLTYPSMNVSKLHFHLLPFFLSFFFLTDFNCRLPLFSQSVLLNTVMTASIRFVFLKQIYFSVISWLMVKLSEVTSDVWRQRSLKTRLLYQLSVESITSFWVSLRRVFLFPSPAPLCCSTETGWKINFYQY